MRRSELNVTAAVVAAIVVVGLGACSAPPDRPDTDPEPASVVPAAAAADAAGRGPTAVRDGVPVGWSHDEAGALAAATSAVSLTGDIAGAGFITRTDMIETLATARYGPTLAAESAAQWGQLTGELGTAGVSAQSVAFTELPLTARAVDADESSARVTVWTVSVITVADVAAPRQVWRTVTVALVWEAGDWRVDGWTTESGPTPALALNAPVATIEQVLDVTSWSRVGGG